MATESALQKKKKKDLKKQNCKTNEQHDAAWAEEYC